MFDVQEKNMQDFHVIVGLQYMCYYNWISKKQRYCLLCYILVTTFKREVKVVNQMKGNTSHGFRFNRRLKKYCKKAGVPLPTECQ